MLLTGENSHEYDRTQSRNAVVSGVAAGNRRPSGGKNWIAGNVNWNVAGNWSPGGVPVTGDTVHIAHGDGMARTINYDVNETTIFLVLHRTNR
jgi:hypothetical protein